MIRTVIIDDELNGRETLCNLLKDSFPEVSLIEMASSKEEGFASIARAQPDLVFLDIEMPFGNGFDLLNALPEINFDVIFVTAFDQYAMKAIKFSALDFLLKPIDLDELRQALKKVEKRKEEKNYQKRNFESLLHNLKNNGRKRKMAVPSAEGLDFVLLEEILYCNSDDNYTILKFVNGSKITISRTLKEYEELLTGEGFCRIHNSFLINLHHIKKYIKGDGGYVVMNDGSSIEVSRRRKTEFLEQLALIY